MKTERVKHSVKQATVAHAIALTKTKKIESQVRTIDRQAETLVRFARHDQLRTSMLISVLKQKHQQITAVRQAVQSTQQSSPQLQKVPDNSSALGSILRAIVFAKVTKSLGVLLAGYGIYKRFIAPADNQTIKLDQQAIHNNPYVIGQRVEIKSDSELKFIAPEIVFKAQTIEFTNAQGQSTEAVVETNKQLSRAGPAAPFGYGVRRNDLKRSGGYSPSGTFNRDSGLSQTPYNNGGTNRPSSPRTNNRPTEPQPAQSQSIWQGGSTKVGLTEVPQADSGTIDRREFDAQLADPRVRAALAARAKIEVGSQPAAQQMWIESVLNRASSRRKSIMSAVDNSDGYYPRKDDGKFRTMAGGQAGTHWDQLIDKVHKGSDLSRGATGNSSEYVGFGQGSARRQADGSIWAPGQTSAAGGERFGREKPDLKWAPKYLPAGDILPDLALVKPEVLKALPDTPKGIPKIFQPGTLGPNAPETPDLVGQLQHKNVPFFRGLADTENDNPFARKAKSPFARRTFSSMGNLLPDAPPQQATPVSKPKPMSITDFAGMPKPEPAAPPVSARQKLSNRPWFIGDSIAGGQHGNYGGSGSIKADQDGYTYVGAGPGTIKHVLDAKLADPRQLKSMRERGVVFSSGLTNDPKQTQSALEQIKQLREAGIPVRVVGVRNSVPGSEQINQQLREAAGQGNFIDITKMKGDRIHPAIPELQRAIEQSRDVEPAATTPGAAPTPDAIPNKPIDPAAANSPDKLFFQTGGAYSRQQIDSMIAQNGSNIVIGQNQLVDQGSLAYAKSKGAKTHWYMIGSGEPASGYSGNGVQFPSDQKEIAANMREMGFTSRSQWDNGGWLEWHKKRLLEAKKEGRLPDYAEFDSINNANPERVADVFADFSKWRRENGITTRLVPKNLEAQYFPVIDKMVREGKIDKDALAPYQILEEYASGAHVAAATRWGNQNGLSTFQTTNTMQYQSPAGGFTFNKNISTPQSGLLLRPQAAPNIMPPTTPSPTRPPPGFVMPAGQPITTTVPPAQAGLLKQQQEQQQVQQQQQVKEEEKEQEVVPKIVDQSTSAGKGGGKIVGEPAPTAGPPKIVAP